MCQSHFYWNDLDIANNILKLINNKKIKQK